MSVIQQQREAGKKEGRIEIVNSGACSKCNRECYRGKTAAGCVSAELPMFQSDRYQGCQLLKADEKKLPESDPSR